MPRIAQISWMELLLSANMRRVSAIFPFVLSFLGLPPIRPRARAAVIPAFVRSPGPTQKIEVDGSSSLSVKRLGRRRTCYQRRMKRTLSRPNLNSFSGVDQHIWVSFRIREIGFTESEEEPSTRLILTFRESELTAKNCCTHFH